MGILDILFNGGKFQKQLNEVNKTMANQQAQIDAIVQKLTKAKAEIIRRLEALQEDVGENENLTALLALAEDFDNIVPDEVTTD